MSDINKKNNINNLLTNSYYNILDYKLDLIKLYKLIFTFCENHNIIISNSNINLNIINNKDSNKTDYKLHDINNDFIFNLLSTDPYKYSIILSNYIYKEYSKYVVVSSYLNNKEILITVDNNKLITFNLLFDFNENIFKKLNFKKIRIQPFKQEEYNLYYSSNLYELLNISYKLYHPSNFLNFIKSNLDEKIIKNNILGYSLEEKYSVLIKSILPNKITSIVTNNIIRKNINLYLLNNINNENYIDIKFILLDDYASDLLLELINQKSIKSINIINTENIMTLIIPENKIKLLENKIKEYLNNNNLDKEYKYNIKKVNNYIIDDFRLKKYIISLKYKEKKQIILLNIYTSVDYELFPLINIYKNILLPHPIVIIRFYILNMFNQLLYNPNYDNNLELLILEKIKLNNDYIKIINNMILNKEIIINYYGQYINDRIDKFKYGAKIYRPWQYKLKNNKLLQIY